MDNNLFLKNILILIFCVILIHLFLNDFLANSTCNNTNEQFINKPELTNKIKVYLFYADWCGHCKHYKPIFNEFKNKVKNNKDIIIIEINADDKKIDTKYFFDKFGVDGFPTTIIEKDNKIIKLVGQKSVKDLIKATVGKEVADQKSVKDLMAAPLRKESFENENDIIVYNFNTTWCPHSVTFKPIWDKFNESLKNYENIKAKEIKCDLNENIDMCRNFNITTVPTIVIYKNNELKNYNGSRTFEGLMEELNLKISDNELDDKVKIHNENEGMNFMVIKDENIKTRVYNFNTTWCKYSRDFESEWNTFTNSLKSSDGIKAIDVKCDNDQNKDLCQKFNIPGYPTVVIESDNKIEIYKDERTSKNLRKHLGLN